MSQFLTNHPKLVIAFNGAVRNYARKASLIDKHAVAFSIGAFALIVTRLFFPVTAVVALSVGINGARKALKQLKVAKKEASQHCQGAKELQASNDRVTAERAGRAREELRATKSKLKKLLPHRHARR